MDKNFKTAEANVVAAARTNDARLFGAAQVYATLSLAYEQRTANLIALFGEGTIRDLEDPNALRAVIEERLDLK